MFRILQSLLVVSLILAVSDAPAAPPTPAEVFTAKVFQPDQSTDGAENVANLTELKYQLLEPKHIEPGKKYPLVLFLHGKGERGDDNSSQLSHAAAAFPRNRDRYPAYVIFPQCPETHRWVKTEWGLADGTDTFNDAPAPPMALALQLVDSFAQKDSVDTSRMYVCGLSMGGY